MRSSRSKGTARAPIRGGANRGDRGFMLVEAIAAIGLLALAMAAVGTLLVNQIRFGVSNATGTTAIALAEQEFEELRGIEYEDIASRSRTVSGSTTYTVTTSVQANLPGPNMKSITVEVAWSDYGQARTYTVDGIYTDITR